jgi:mono/diheme cytochrome c family protein
LVVLVATLIGCNEATRKFPGPDDVVALVPWFSNMREHVAIRPYKMPLQPVDGTVPIGGADVVPAAIPGNQAQLDAMLNPVQRTAASIERGEDRYAIYCELCHGADGSGNGPVAPAIANTVRNLLDQAQVDRSDGWIYGVIANGFGALMPEYGSKISQEDRWHIVNYVRVLQGVAQ